eukprot:CAMPEP_0194086570 /NCGR_PEP_ID=MMETSP0149-20130528/21613_1 /TAXON_ID=122233 /ORGANISM="Chaetoceros debilis, Strain MM31A-1" /LENGTH=1080 /DNA_ID=CAMNT_0038769683 /DNA_START=479 /DNA_END=3721 /DNA_ORIENTATION=+
MGFALGSASVVQVVKLLEPIETMMLIALTNVVILKMGAGHGITVTKALSVLIIVSGTAMLLIQKSAGTGVLEDATDDETSINNTNTNTNNPVNYQSVLFALCSGFAMASRNVVKKISLSKVVAAPAPPSRSITQVWIQSTLKGLSNYFSITAVAAVPATLCFLLAEIIGSSSPQINDNNMLISAWMLTSKSVGSVGKEAIVFHGLYNLSSISVLGLISAQSHSILNVGKRIVNVLIASIAFQEPIGVFGIIGLFIAAVGGMLYSFEGSNGNGNLFTVLLGQINLRRSFCSACIGLIVSVQLLSGMNLNGYQLPSIYDNVYYGSTVPSSIIQKNNGKYAVWMFPFPPPARTSNEIIALLAQEDNEEETALTLICAYSNACKAFEGHTKINLRDLTQGTYYHNYVRDQAYHKVRHMNDFPYHIQAIAMLGLLLNEEGENVCVRTLGGRTEFCDVEAFSSYDPYEGNELNATNFPFELFNDGPVSEENNSLSLAPRVMLTTEKFAMWGVEDIPKSMCKHFNSGEDVQSYAGAAWLPFISEIRDKLNALRNYNGYYIGNALMAQNPFNTTDADYTYENMKKITLASIYSTEPGIKGMEGYIRNYTNSVGPFGCRSTLTDGILKARKIKSYFSACLTLTTDMQGAILSNEGYSKSTYIKNDILKPNATKLPSPEQKTKIIFIDVVDQEAVPRSVRDSKDAIYMAANVEPWYPNCEEKMGRYSYSYKLLSTYANQAKVVITSRIHAGLPAVGLGIPVIFVENSGAREQWLPGGKQSVGRVEGLLDVFHRVQRGVDGKNWTFGNLTGDVPHSDGVHLADRYRASFWNRLKKTHYYRDSAKMFGMVPFQRLGRKNIEIGIQDTFHFVLESDLTWQTKRAIEHVFYFHPNCKVYVHSNDISPNELETFTEAGFNLVVQAYDLDLLHEEELHVPHKLRNNDFQRASLPLLLLRKLGGIYLSKETLVLKTIAAGIEEGVVLQENGDIAMAYHSRQSKDVVKSLTYMTKSRSMVENSGNLTWSFPVLSNLDTLKCIEDIKWGLDDDTKDKIAVSLHPSSFASIKTIKIDTECYKIIEKLCIFCDEIHWDYNE